MFFTVVCKELTGENCGFVARGGTPEEAKNNFYAHGAESPTHRERYVSATAGEKSVFSKRLDEYLSRQK
jgi:hypothetical protein